MDMTKTRVTLYNSATGEKRDFYPIDAMRCLERGGWSESPVSKAQAQPTPAAQTEPAVKEAAPAAQTATKNKA